VCRENLSSKEFQYTSAFIVACFLVGSYLISIKNIELLPFVVQLEKFEYYISGGHLYKRLIFIFCDVYGLLFKRRVVIPRRKRISLNSFSY
jgi:hypothetical protein